MRRRDDQQVTTAGKIRQTRQVEAEWAVKWSHGAMEPGDLAISYEIRLCTFAPAVEMVHDDQPRPCAEYVTTVARLMERTYVVINNK